MAALKIVNVALRGVQFFWALLVMALTGNMIAQQVYGNAVVNYAMFCSVFAMLALFYLLPASIVDSLSFHPIIPIVLDSLISVFWFTCAVALAAELPPQACSNVDFRRSNGIILAASSGNREKRCREGQATDAFLWFGFAAFVGSAVISGLQGGNVSTRPSVRRGGPSMSKV